MQLSSVLLSATALLARAVSGFNLVSFARDPRGTRATLEHDRIGFYDNSHVSDNWVPFGLDPDRQLVSKYTIAFFDRGDGSWRLERTNVGFS
jgi:hypothetical protein